MYMHVYLFDLAFMYNMSSVTFQTSGYFILFYCLGVSMTDCTETGYVNEWDQYHKYYVPTGKVITGITSIHHGHHE